MQDITYICHDLNTFSMRKNTLSLLLFFICINAFSQSHNLDSIYSCLDNEIIHANKYVAKKKAVINLLKKQLDRASENTLKYAICYQLYEEYRPFENKMAMLYLNQCQSIAEASNNRNNVNECLARLSLCCSNTGLYDEAEKFLLQINVDELNRDGLAVYYQAQYMLNNQLAYYTSVESMKKIYNEKTVYYEDKLLACLPVHDNLRYQVFELKLISEGKMHESMKLNTEWLHHVKKGSHKYAMMALFRYLEYKAARDTVNMMYWIAESALADVRNGVMDQGSMWEIANQLEGSGDIDRSYHYITFTSDCANVYDSRQRRWQISPLLARIAKKYKAESDHKNSQILMAALFSALLALMLLVSVFYVNSQRKRLALTGRKLKLSNSQLHDINSKLSDLNRQLASSISKLGESNRVKEEYIGRFMGLCSLYVDKIENFRRMVNKMVKNRQFDELFKETRSTSLKEKELDELYTNFDDAFLHLFPTFVDEFNALLIPKERIMLTDDGHMPVSLRIFALIRVGIDDSSKIAEFLHYSVNTIYNYKARVKNSAISDREDFERRVKKLGAQNND